MMELNRSTFGDDRIEVSDALLPTRIEEVVASGARSGNGVKVAVGGGGNGSSSMNGVVGGLCGVSANDRGSGPLVESKTAPLAAAQDSNSFRLVNINEHPFKLSKEH